MTAKEIAQKWVSRLGLGFHPDNFSGDYSPALPKEQAEEYDADMNRLFSLKGEDVYAVCVEAMEEAGLCGDVA